MKNTEQHIEDLHFEHKLWQSEANFYRDELKIYEKQITNIGERNSAPEAKEKVHYFKEQFKAENKALEALYKEIAHHEHVLTTIEKDSSYATSSSDSSEHNKMRNQIMAFKEKYSKLKKEFQLFLEDWM